jgi:hypothetical protein
MLHFVTYGDTHFTDHSPISILSVQDLFSLLVEKAHSRTFQESESWKEALDEKYHTFAGNYHALSCKNPHRFEFKSAVEPYVFLKLAPPTASPAFFNAEGYAKHLIGLVSNP